MSGPPSVSVVVPARDAAETIESCVESLRRLDYPADLLEVIVVDNGSRDDTAARASAGGARVVHEPRPGAGPARNAGTRASAGSVVAFTDADCVAEPRWLSLMVAALESPAVGIACGEVRGLGPGTATERFDQTVHDTRRAVEVFRPPYAVGCNWASPRRLLLELGGFDPECVRGQDVELSYRVVAAGYEIAHVPGAIVRHRNQRTVAGLVREGFRHGRHGRRVERKHRGLLASYGIERVRPPALGRIASQALAALRGPERATAACEAAFLSGKRAGMAYGAWRERASASRP